MSIYGYGHRATHMDTHVCVYTRVYIYVHLYAYIRRTEWHVSKDV